MTEPLIARAQRTRLHRAEHDRRQAENELNNPNLTAEQALEIAKQLTRTRDETEAIALLDPWPLHHPAR